MDESIGNWFFRFRMSWLIMDNGAPPTVETKQLLVHSVGNLDMATVKSHPAS
jgi:hypothetical protein